MTHTNLRPYSFLAVVFATALSAACGSSGGSTPEGAGGSGNNGGDGGSSNGGSGGKKFDAGTDPNRNKVMAGNICQRVAEIQCAGEAACCASPGRTVDTCTTQQKKACAESLGLDALSADPITAFDAAKASTALEKFEMLASTCDTSISVFAVGPNGFRGAAAGTVAPGGTCNPGMGTNRVAATTAALASCKDSTTEACLTSSTDPWKCSPRADAGGHCFTDANCKDGLFCDNASLDPDAGKCAATKANGADCMLGNECTSYACKNGKCVAQTADTAYCLGTQ
jgi:hypothetical protein